MSSYNLSRGEELFFKEIENLSVENPRQKNGLKFMSSLFAGKVGVMPEGNLSELKFTDEKELFFELNAVPSYKKLSAAILYSLQNCKEDNVISQIKFTIESYKNNSFSLKKPQSQNNVLDEKTLELQEEIENSLKSSQNIVSSEFIDSNTYDVKMIDIDAIDLIDDFEDEDLTLEGMRSAGIIDTNFDTSTDKEPTVLKSRNLLPFGKYEFDQDSNPVIYCPYTGSSNVYQIDSSTYASFETDQPFRIIFNLADFNPN